MENYLREGIRPSQRKNAVAEKSMEFAVRIVNMSRHLQAQHREHVISAQVLRSGTSIGANIREANSAHSKSDFIAKLAIALKECDETGFWLELLCRTFLLEQKEYQLLENDRQELFALLTAIIKTARRNSQ